MVGVGTNQHFVPQFYLKRFSKNKLVSVYSKKSKCFFSTLKSIKSRSSSLGFYDDFTNDGDVTDIIDQALESVEDKTSKLLKCLHDQCIDLKNHNMTPILCIQQKNDLSVFLTLQLLRTSKVRNALHCFADAAKAKLKKFADDNSRVFPNILVDGKSIQLEALRNIENLIYCQNYLLDARWVLVYNDTSIPFITSDNPVYGILLKNEIGVMGIIPFFSEDREICFPISPKIYLRIIRKGISGYNSAKEYENKIMVVNNPNYIEAVNAFCFFQAHEEVYNHPDSKRSVVEKCLHLLGS